MRSENAFFFYGNTLRSDKAVVIDGMPPLHLAPITGLGLFDAGKEGVEVLQGSR